MMMNTMKMTIIMMKKYIIIILKHMKQLEKTLITDRNHMQGEKPGDHPRNNQLLTNYQYNKNK
jgi:hypothetical protein